MTGRQWIMALAVAGASALAIFGDRTPEDDLAAPAASNRASNAEAHPASRTSSRRESERAASAPELLSLHVRQEPPSLPAEGAEAQAPRLFASTSWDPPPPKVVPAPPPPPTAPALPYAFVGKKQEGGVWEVYVAQGDNVLVIRPNSTIDNTYRVGAIAPPLMNLTYLPLNQIQQLNIGAPD
jgi:hypothetical protein